MRDPAAHRRSLCHLRCAALLLLLVPLPAGADEPVPAANSASVPEPPPAGEQAVPEPPPTGEAAIPEARTADEHVARSAELYRRERYVEAAEEMDAAYRLRPRPLYLFNAAQAYRRVNRPREALHFYYRFLRADPAGPLVSETRGYIRNMEQLLLEQERAARSGTALRQAQGRIERTEADLLLTRDQAARTEEARRRVRRRAFIIGGVSAAVITGLAISLPLLLTREPSTDWGFHTVSFGLTLPSGGRR